MQYRLLSICLAAIPAVTGYLVPRDYLDEDLAIRSVYADDDFETALFARSAGYEEDNLWERDEELLELFARAGGKGGGKAPLKNEPKKQGSGKLSPQNSVSSQNSFKTATSQPGSPSNEQVKVDIPKQNSGKKDDKKPPSKGGKIGEKIQQGANWAKNNPQHIAGAVGPAVTTAGLYSGNQNAVNAGNTISMAGGVANLAMQANKDAKNKGGKKNKRDLDDTLDHFFARRSLGLEFDSVDHLLAARAVGIDTALDGRDLEEEFFGVEYY